MIVQGGCSLFCRRPFRTRRGRGRGCGRRGCWWGRGETFLTHRVINPASEPALGDFSAAFTARRADDAAALPAVHVTLGDLFAAIRARATRHVVERLPHEAALIRAAPTIGRTGVRLTALGARRRPVVSITRTRSVGRSEVVAQAAHRHRRRFRIPSLDDRLLVLGANGAHCPPTAVAIFGCRRCDRRRAHPARPTLSGHRLPTTLVVALARPLFRRPSRCLAAVGALPGVCLYGGGDDGRTGAAAADIHFVRQLLLRGESPSVADAADRKSRSRGKAALGDGAGELPTWDAHEPPAVVAPLLRRGRLAKPTVLAVRHLDGLPHRDAAGRARPPLRRL